MRPSVNDETHSFDRYWFLYVEHLTLLVACAYFTLAFLLTAYAVIMGGHEARATPVPVLMCWCCYGILVPASLACTLMWTFVTQKTEDFPITSFGAGTADRGNFFSTVGEADPFMHAWWGTLNAIRRAYRASHSDPSRRTPSRFITREPTPMPAESLVRQACLC